MKNMQNLTICQVSLSLMILDICKFCCLYILVLFAFSCGNHWPTSTHWLFIFIRRDIMGKQCQFWCKNFSCSPAGVDLKVGPNFYRKIIFVRDESAALVLCCPGKKVGKEKKGIVCFCSMLSFRKDRTTYESNDITL